MQILDTLPFYVVFFVYFLGVFFGKRNLFFTQHIFKECWGEEYYNLCADIVVQKKKFPGDGS